MPHQCAHTTVRRIISCSRWLPHLFDAWAVVLNITNPRFFAAGWGRSSGCACNLPPLALCGIGLVGPILLSAPSTGVLLPDHTFSPHLQNTGLDLTGILSYDSDYLPTALPDTSYRGGPLQIRAYCSRPGRTLCSCSRACQTACCFAVWLPSQTRPTSRKARPFDLDRANSGLVCRCRFSTTRPMPPSANT